MRMAISWRRRRRPQPGLLPLALAGLVSACGPQSVADRNDANTVAVGGAMRANGQPPPPATPPLTPAGESPAAVAPPPPPTDAAPPDPDPPPPTPSTGAPDAAADLAPPDPAPNPAPPDAAPAVDPPSPPDAQAATPDASPPDTDPTPPPPPPPPPPADPCANRPSWQPATTYAPGDQVTNGKPRHRYECRPWPASGWCPLAAYEPGHPTTPWPQAWIDHGACP